MAAITNRMRACGAASAVLILAGIRIAALASDTPAGELWDRPGGGALPGLRLRRHPPAGGCPMANAAEASLASVYPVE